MKTIRAIATILVYGPVIGMVGVALALVSAFLIVDAGKPDVLAQRITVAVYIAVLPVVTFPIGEFMHGFAANRTGIYKRSVWRLILGSSILFCFTNPAGIILGGTALVLLFTLQTFKIMRTVEHAVPE